METIHAKDLREKTIEELESLVVKYKNEAMKPRQRKNSDSIKPHELKASRKIIARILTVITEKKYAEVFEKHKNDKKLPKDLRLKLTKAKRLALTKKQKNMKVHRIVKRRRQFPKVYFSYSE